MNIHHLELFYYVARHGGISEAVRNIPYGIQQPAMSGQIIQLEQSLGLNLFQRRPFALTPAGQELYEFIRPFFENVGAMGDKLRGGISQHIRIGASEIVLREHLPDILQEVRRRFPRLKITLRQAYHPQLENWLARQEIDLAITLLQGKPGGGIHTLALFDLPLILLMPAGGRYKSAEALWKLDKIEEALITLPTNEPIYKNFQQGLARRGVDWFTSIEVSSVDLVEAYVAKGYGIGLSVAIPAGKPKTGVRAVPLPDFDPVTFGVLWQGRTNPLLEAFLEVIRGAAKTLMA